MGARPLAALAGVLAATLSLASCAGAPVRTKAATSDVPSAGKFPHARLSMLLEKTVSDDGLVDYEALAKDDSLLDEYLAEAARVSPEATPHLFPTEEERLAYWLNVHNACALRAVLALGHQASLAGSDHRIDGMTFVVGRKALSIHAILNHIRSHFPDPRVHFVLVRGRRAGPPLRKAAFEAATLEEALTSASRAFVNDPRNVRFQPPALQVALSRVILDFRGDFDRQASQTVGADERLVGVINRYRDSAHKIVANTVVPLPYDERLNDVRNR
jgi:hypothetical protein